MAVALHNNIQLRKNLKLSSYVRSSTELKVNEVIYIEEIIMLAVGIATIQVIRGTYRNVTEFTEGLTKYLSSTW
jgi:hypothetical protein